MATHPFNGAGRFELCVRGSFSKSMNSHQGLKKIGVGQLLLLGIEFAHRHSLRKGLADLRYIFGRTHLSIGQKKRGVTDAPDNSK